MCENRSLFYILYIFIEIVENIFMFGNVWACALESV